MQSAHPRAPLEMGIKQKAQRDRLPIGRGSCGTTVDSRAALLKRSTGCGSLRLLRALGGTRILQAAAPTAPPCIRHWRRSSPLQTRGCSPLIIPRQRSKRKNASRFAQRIFFFRFSDLQAPQSLRDSSPQGATNANIKIIFPLIMARAHAVAISNSVTPAQTTRHILWRLHLPLQNPPPHGNRSPVRRGSSWPGPSGRRPAPAARRRRAR